MGEHLWSVIVGGSIGIIGTLLATLFTQWRATHRQRKTTENVIRAQLEFTIDKVTRFSEGHLVPEALKTGKPLYKTLADHIGFLSPTQATASTKALLMYFELAETGNMDRAQAVIAACKQALNSF